MSLTRFTIDIAVREVSAAPTGAFVLRCGSVIAGTVAATLIGVGGTSAAPKPDPAPQRQVPNAVKRLWSEYPLQPGRGGRTQRPTVQPQVAPRSAAGASDDGRGVPSPLLLTLAAGVLGLTIMLLLLLRDRIPAISLRGMPSRRFALPAFAVARPSTTGLGIARGRKGGHTMSHFRRRRSSGPEDEKGVPKDPNATTQRFTPYSLGATEREPSTETQPGKSPPRPEPETRPVESASASPDDPAAYERLGEHVSTVLSSADEAAKRLHASATKEAERIRGEAEDYARKTRAAADAYAEQRRENAETEASAITADAEKRAREARNAAEEQAADIQHDAIRRREALLRESEHSEERLQNLLKVFRAMTERLENLVSATDAPPPGQAEAPVDNDLTEALAKSRGSVASHPGAPRARD